MCAVAASETRYGEKGDEKGHQQWPDAANLLMFRDQATEWWRTQSQSNPSPLPNSLLTGKRTGNFQELPDLLSKKRQMAASQRASGCKFPTSKTGNYFRGTEKLSPGTGISMHPLAEVRFSPESGRVRRKPSCLLRANSGHSSRVSIKRICVGEISECQSNLRPFRAQYWSVVPRMNRSLLFCS